MRAVVSHNDPEYRLLLPASNRRLVHDATHDLTVYDDQPAVVGCHIWSRFLETTVELLVDLVHLVAL